MRSLAKAGAKNYIRDCCSRFPKNCMQAMKFYIPMADARTRKVSKVLQSIILPHVLFSNLANHYRSAFRRFICSGREQLVSWWKTQENTAQVLENEDLLEVPNYQEVMVPLIVHGDGVPCVGLQKSWMRMVDAISWSSLMAEPGTGTLDLVMLIWIVFHCQLSYGSRVHKIKL